LIESTTTTHTVYTIITVIVIIIFKTFKNVLPAADDVQKKFFKKGKRVFRVSKDDKLKNRNTSENYYKSLYYSRCY